MSETEDEQDRGQDAGIRDARDPQTDAAQRGLGQRRNHDAECDRANRVFDEPHHRRAVLRCHALCNAGHGQPGCFPLRVENAANDDCEQRLIRLFLPI